MLKGKMVGLRAVERDDLGKLLGWRNQPNFRKFFREYRELNEENQNQWFESRVIADEHTRMFSIVLLDTGELIGACGLCYIDWVNRCADFSIYIGKDSLYIDSEYAIDAAKLMMAYGFDELNLHRLWTEIYEIDDRKKIIFKELGFEHEATHISTHWTEGRWVNSLYYRYLDSDYLNFNE